MEVIIKMMELPISLIIVGLGKEDFKSLEVLENLEEYKKFNANQIEVRDIVRFVDLKQVILLFSIKV
jgi:hypothetical protein